MKSKLLNWLYLSIFVEPPIFSIVTAYSKIHLVYMYLKVLLIVYVFLKFIFTQNNKDQLMWFLIVFGVWIFQILSTIINDGNIQLISISYFSVAAACLFFGNQFQKNYSNTVITMAHYLGVLSLLNFIFMILYPNGLVEGENWRGEIGYWLLGSENNLPGILLPTVVLQLMSYSITKHRITIIYLFIASISIVLSTSSTGLVGLLIFALFAMFQYFDIEMKVIGNWFTLGKGVIIVAILSVVLIAGSNLSVVSVIVEDWLGKDMTFTGRSDIWMRFWAVIVESPFLGYGVYFTEALRDSFNTSHQHNYYLHLLFQGGIFTLLSFVALLLVCSNKIKQVVEVKAVRFLNSGIFAFLIMCLTEVYGDFIFIIPFYLLLTGCYMSQYYNRPIQFLKKTKSYI